VDRSDNTGAYCTYASDSSSLDSE